MRTQGTRTTEELQDSFLSKRGQITRQDVTDLLSSIGNPGEKQDEKRAAVSVIDEVNFQGHSIMDDLESYSAF